MAAATSCQLGIVSRLAVIRLIHLDAIPFLSGGVFFPKERAPSVQRPKARSDFPETFPIPPVEKFQISPPARRNLPMGGKVFFRNPAAKPNHFTEKPADWGHAFAML
jgi:hypothetical protein